MIDINKTYKTQDGREVRLVSDGGRSNFPVFGDVAGDDGYWHPCQWTRTGKAVIGLLSGADLIEVVPEVVPRTWDLAVHRGSGALYEWESTDSPTVFEHVTVTEIPEGWHLVPKPSALRQPPSGIPNPPAGFEYWGEGPLPHLDDGDECLVVSWRSNYVSWYDNSGSGVRGGLEDHYAIRIGSELHKLNFGHGQA